MTRYWHSGDLAMSRGGTWKDHIDRGSPGGEDWPLKYGTPVYAPDDGFLQFLPASARRNKGWGPAGFDGAGQVLLLTRSDGVELVLFHASAGEGLTLGGPDRYVSEGDLAGKSGGSPGTPSGGLSTGPHAHEHVVINNTRYPMSQFVAGGGNGGGGIPPVPNPKPPTRRRRKSMSTLYTTVFSTAVPMPQRVKDQAARCGTPITNTAGRVFALMGDSPGTPANVIITQEGTFANQLAADHTGTIPGLVENGARPVSPDIFLRLFDAYLTFSGGATQQIPGNLATTEHLAAAVDQIKSAIPPVPTKGTFTLN